MPATTAWPYFRVSTPSSKVFKITPFFPAYRPFRIMTTLPDFKLQNKKSTIYHIHLVYLHSTLSINKYSVSLQLHLKQ